MDEADTLLKSVLSEAQKNVRKEDNNKRSREKRRAEGSTGVRVSSFFHAVSGPHLKNNRIKFQIMHQGLNLQLRPQSTTLKTLKLSSCVHQVPQVFNQSLIFLCSTLKCNLIVCVY